MQMLETKDIRRVAGRTVNVWIGGAVSTRYRAPHVLPRGLPREDPA